MNRLVIAALAALLAATTVGVADADPAPGLDLDRLSGPTPFTDGCDGQPPRGTLYVDAEVQPHLAVAPGNPGHMVAVWQQDRWSGVAARGLVTAVTFDGGAHWRRAVTPFSRCGGGEYWRATDSATAIGREGTAYVVSLGMNGAVAGGDHAIQVSRSVTGGRSWAPPVTLVREGADPTRFVFNDLPWITGDPTRDGTAYAAWGRVVTEPIVSTLEVTRTTDKGRTWTTPRAVLDHGENRLVQGVRIVVLPDGALVAFYSVGHYDPVTFEQLDQSFHAVRSTDRGDTWSAPVMIAGTDAAGTTEPVSGRGVRDGSGYIGQIAVGPRGELHAVWQDSVFYGGARDGVALSTSTDGGRTWSTPAQVNRFSDPQAFSPAVAVSREGVVGVAYSVRGTGSTAANWVSQSSDGGRHWHRQRVSHPYGLGSAPVIESPPGSLYLGDYHGMVANDTHFVSAASLTNWRQPDNRTDIVAMSVPIRRR